MQRKINREIETILLDIEKKIGRVPFVLTPDRSVNIPDHFSVFTPISEYWSYVDKSVDIVIASPAYLNQGKKIARFATCVLGENSEINEVIINSEELDKVENRVNNIQMQIDWVKKSGKNRGKIFFASPMMPEYDKESGSRRLFHLLLFFRKAGYDVYLFTTSDKDADAIRYSEKLLEAGINTSFQAEVSIEKAIKTYQPFDFIFLPFYNFAKAFMAVIQKTKGEARLVIDSVDLHFIRLARKQFLEVGRLIPPFDTKVVDELNSYRQADFVVTVSDKEAELLNNLFATKDKVFGIRDCELAIPRQGILGRKGILLIGNYRHLPNRESLEYFLDEILPLVNTEIIEENPVYLVGNELPVEFVKSRYPDLLPNIRIVGWVPEVKPYFQATRISVVPLTYGAGTKRKLLQSLIYGTPAVTTTIGAEGFALINGEHAIIEDDPIAFARSIEKLCLEDDLWENISLKGVEHINSLHSFDSVYNQFEHFLSIIER